MRYSLVHGAFALGFELLPVRPLSLRLLSARSGHPCRRLDCPLWVISRHLQRKKTCPLYPRKRTLKRVSRMSALRQ